MKTLFLALSLALSSAANDDLARVAEAVKPLPQELKWQRIPWILDLAEGQRLAQAERRPLLLWVSGDDPLDRC